MELKSKPVLPISPIVQKYLVTQQPSGQRTFIQIVRPLETGPVKILGSDGVEIRMIPKPAPVELPTRSHDLLLSKNVETLALAFHWSRLLEIGRFDKAEDIARSEGINPTLVRKALRLTLLAPSAIINFISHPEISLDTLKREAIPLDWHIQEDMFPGISGKTTKKQRVPWKKVALPARTA